MVVKGEGGAFAYGERGLDVLVFVLCVEAGAVLRCEVSMTSDDGLWEDVAEGCEEMNEGGFLCWGTGVLGMVVGRC